MDRPVERSDQIEGLRSSLPDRQPTDLIYNENGEGIKWGQDATDFQTFEDLDPGFSVKNWKLGLRSLCMPPVCQFRRNLKAAAERLKNTSDNFIEDFFRAVVQFILEGRNSSLLEQPWRESLLQEFKHTISLPLGWPQQESRVLCTTRPTGMNKSLDDSPLAISMKHNTWSISRFLGTTIPEECIISGVDFLSLLNTTIFKLESQVEPLSLLYSISSFTKNLHAASINCYLFGSEDIDEETYCVRSRKRSSKGARSRSLKSLFPTAAFGAVMNFLRVPSSYVVSSNYGILRTRLHDP